MKLSEYKGEDAIDVLADILEPAAIIVQDKEIWSLIQNGGRRIDGITYALKRYKKEILQILARLDNVPVEEYKCNVFTLPIKILELLNDEDLVDFFTSQRQMAGSVSSGVAMEPTQEAENE